MGIFETSKLTKACELSVMTFVVLDPQNYTNLHESCVFLKWGCPTRCPPLRRKLRKSFGKLRKLYDNFQSKLQKNLQKVAGKLYTTLLGMAAFSFCQGFLQNDVNFFQVEKMGSANPRNTSSFIFKPLWRENSENITVFFREKRGNTLHFTFPT